MTARAKLFIAAREHLFMNGSAVLAAALVIVIAIVIVAVVAFIYFPMQHTLYCERTFAGNLSAIQDCVTQWG